MRQQQGDSPNKKNSECILQHLPVKRLVGHPKQKRPDPRIFLENLLAYQISEYAKIGPYDVRIIRCGCFDGFWKGPIEVVFQCKQCPIGVIECAANNPGSQVNGT